MTDIANELKTLKELEQELVKAGMPQEDVVAAKFNSKAQIITILNTLKAKNVIEKVDSIEELPNPSEEKKIEKAWRSKAQIMWDKWMASPKVQILFPSDPGKNPGKVEWRKDAKGNDYQVALTPADSIQEVQVNGAKYLVPKGVLVEVPKPVADRIAEMLQLGSQAGADILLDRIDPKTGRPVSEAF